MANMDDALDLSQVVIVNESRDERIAGDVTVFRSIAAACAWLEPWWVEDREGFAFNGSGDRLILATNGRKVFVEGREVCADGQNIVRHWLRTWIAHTSDPPDTISELILRTGFQEGCILPLSRRP